MKKLILMAILCLATLGASAEIRYRSINNIHGTNIVLVDSDAPDKITVSEAILSNNGRKYRAKDIRCNVRGGVATYKLKFRRLTVFKNCKLTLTVNGRKVTVDIQKAMSHR